MVEANSDRGSCSSPERDRISHAISKLTHRPGRFGYVGAFAMAATAIATIFLGRIILMALVRLRTEFRVHLTENPRPSPSTSFPTSRRILALFFFPIGLLEPSVSVGYWDGIWDPQSR